MERLDKILNLHPKIQKKLALFELKKELEKDFGKLNLDIESKNLVIKTQNGSTLQELSFKKRDILRKFKEIAPFFEIKEIKIKRA